MEGLEQCIARARQAARENRNAKWVITGLILLVLFAYGFLIYATAKSFDTDKLLKEMEERSVTALPEVSASLIRALKAVAPDYQREFEAKAQEAMPVLAERLPEERDKLIDNVSKRVEKRIHEGLEIIAKKQEAKLLKTFPKLKDEKKLAKVSEHLQLAVQAATAELLHERLEKCVDAIMRVHDVVDRFKPDHIREKDRLLRDRLAHVWENFVASPTTPSK